MTNLFEDDEEKQIETRQQQRDAEILTEIDGEKSDAQANVTIVLAGLVIAVVLALPALGIMAWKKGQTAAPVAAQVAPAPPQNRKATPIVWYYTLQEGLNAAAITGKPIMIDFYATWCGPCQMMDAQTYTDAAVMMEAQSFINVKLDAEQYRDDARRYNITGYPTMIWTDSAGNERGRVKGGYSAAEFLPVMQQYR